MNKFNEVAQTVLKEEIDSKIESHYRLIANMLTKKGIKAYEQDEIFEVVQRIIKLAFDKGYDAAEKNPFK